MPVLRNPFTNAQSGQPTLQQTRHLAAFLHKGQRDHSGYDYIHHPARVANNVKRIMPDADDETMMIAWLHDTIEDCLIAHTQEKKADILRQWGYSETVIQGVQRVTKPDGDTRPYEQVIDDLIATGDKRAMLVKLADNMDNLHPDRQAELAAINPEKAKRLKTRYIESVKKLSTSIGLNKTHIFDSIAHSKPIGLNAAIA